MRKSISVLMVSALLLGGCSTVRNSSLNPFNWFGRSTSTAIASDSTNNPLIPRRASFFRGKPVQTGLPGTPITQVSQLRVARVPGGAVIEATGIAARLGAYDAKLYPDSLTGDGTLGYTFRVKYQPSIRAVGRTEARKITVASFLTEQELAGIHAIRVSGVQNVQTVRR